MSACLIRETPYIAEAYGGSGRSGYGSYPGGESGPAGRFMFVCIVGHLLLNYLSA